MSTALGSVAHVAAPPVPGLSEGWSLRLLHPHGADLDLVHRWMRAPHVAISWKQAWDRPTWARELAGQHAGAHCRPCLVSRGEQALAYVEIYRVARDCLAGHYAFAAEDLGVHVALGDAASIGRGWGSAVLDAVAAALLRSEPECQRIVAEPDAANTAALRAFDKAGFFRAAELELEHKRAALMVRPRNGLAESARRCAAD